MAVSSTTTRDFAACSLICALALAQPIGSLHAQTALGTASVYQDSLPRPQPSPADSDTTGSVPEIAAPADTERSEIARPTLRHLPMSAAGWRINGEAGTLSWQVYMTAAEAAQPQRFRITYAPSVSVLPDSSTLSLSINDTGVVQIGLASPNDLQPVEFNIPPNTLRHGLNEVRISAEQRHRVDCSTDATYELWTQIEPANTGFLAIRSGLPIGLPDLAALAPRADGRLMVRVVFSGKMRPKRIEQVLVASQAIALAARAESPLVSLSTDPDADDGVNLLVGTGDELAALLTSFPERVDISGPTLLFARTTASAAPTLIVSGRSDAELAEAIDQLVATGTTAAAPVASAGYPTHVKIAGGETVRLRDLGISSLEFSGRVFRLPIEIEMPSDFLVADYGKLSINLSGAYAPGLLPGAQVQVHLNGKDAASVSLSNAAGGLFRHDDIFVPLTALRPGRNVLEIAANLPNASDKGCDTTIPLADAGKRFLLLGDSEIRFPPIARVGQMPELSQTSSGGYPYVQADSRQTLYLPKPDRHSMAAALTMAVRLAVAAGHPIPFDLVLSNPGRQPGNGLVVAPARSFDPALMAEIGLDPEAVQRSWKDRAASPEDDAGQPPTKSPGASLPDQQADRRLVTGSLRDDAQAGASLLAIKASRLLHGAGPSAAWTSLLARRSVLDQTWDLIGQGWQQLSGWARMTLAVVGTQFNYVSAEQSPDIGPTSSLIVAQGNRSGDIAGVLTIVTAPDSATLARSVEALVEPARWSELSGRISVLNDAGQILESARARNVQFRTTQPLSVGNLRLIAAGWLSLHSTFYVTVALMLAGLLALLSRMLVKNVGRSNA